MRGYLCYAMSKVNSTIPVYDICSLSGAGQPFTDVIAERFSAYLKVHPNLHRAHGHSFYHLVLFTKGGGSHTIDFRHHAVKAGQIYFMAPGQVHSWSFEGDIDGYVVNFSDGLFSSFLADMRYLGRFPFLAGTAHEQVIQLGEEAFGEAVRILERLVEERAASRPFGDDLIRLDLIALFILAARALLPGTGLPDPTQSGMVTLHHFRKLVNEHYRRYRLPKEYAALLYVTPNHLNALSNDLLGKSAGAVIRDRILLEAKRQLVNADTGIADIGYDLGFGDNSYFTKFFKKYTGMTPEAFRRSLQEPSQTI